MTSTDEKENKRKFAWWVKDSTIELVGKLYKDDDCTSRSEFIEKAVIFYAGYLSTENAKGYLPNVVTSTLKAISSAFYEYISQKSEYLTKGGFPPLYLISRRLYCAFANLKDRGCRFYVFVI